MTTEFDPNESFVSSLCVGRIAENLIFPYPEVRPSEVQTLKGVVEAVDGFLGDKKDEFPKWDVAGELPQEIIEQMKEFGLFGLIIPEEFGGMGLSTTGYSRTLQQMVRHDASCALTVGAHLSIGMKGLLLYGSKEQKEKYLPKLCSGEMLAAFCLTEAGAGSDAASIKTKAEQVGDHWILTGEKIWITNGGIADFFTVFAATKGEHGKMSAFIVTRDMPGVTTGAHENKMGIRASSTTTVSFNNVRLTQEHLLGEEGKGFKIAMNILNSGRTGLGGGCVGSMKTLISLTAKQAKLRKQFNKSLSEFGLIKQKMGQMTIDCYVTESVVNMVSGIIDRGSKDYAIEAAISKIVASEALWRTADEALQVAAGNGYMKEYPYEQMLRDARINRIFEGANEILKLFVALTAMSTAATVLKDIGNIIKNPASVFNEPIKGFGILATYSKRMLTNTVGYGSGTKMTRVHPLLAEQQVIVEGQTRTVTALVDKLLRRHGKSIVDKQFACARLATVIIDIYSLCCVLSRVSQAIENKGSEAALREIQIARVFGHQANERIENTLRQVDNNPDELLKEIADFTFETEKYDWDNLV